MKHIIKNKYLEINKDYDIDKILYFLIDRPDYISSSNNFYWKNKRNQYHREYDLPAVIYSDNGYMEWCKNHKTHRENNKPAIIERNGSKEYWENGSFINDVMTD